MGKPHKHAELIKAWADGEMIETQWADGSWFFVEHPVWDEKAEYRIKPEVKQDTTLKLLMKQKTFRVVESGMEHEYPPNLIMVFDGESGELKHAEVLK